MKTSVLAALGLLLSASAAAACPDPRTDGLGQFTADRTTLSRGISFTAIGGGTHDLSRCTVPGQGYFLAAPHMTLTLDNVARRRVFIGTSTEGGCDPVILARTAEGTWLWDDNSRGRDAQVTPLAEVDGTLNIWVGSANGAPCDTRVVVRVMNDDRQQSPRQEPEGGNDDRDGGGGGGGGGSGGFT